MSNLWTDPAVPKAGWTCDGVDDLGDDRELCAMCGQQWCRFLHSMVHGDTTLRMGCVCAGRVEGDAEAATTRENVAKRIAKAATFEPEWRWAAQSNNPWFKHRGWRCTVFPDKRGTGWKHVVSYQDEAPSFGRRGYTEQKDAMTAATAAFIDQRIKRWKSLEA